MDDKITHDDERIVILTGATASGKSAKALQLAQHYHGVIINADSMQLYKDAPILTAHPTQEEQALIPHLLYGCIPADQPCNVALWLQWVVELIQQTWEQQKLPIIVGGTGMYVSALLKGIAPIPVIPDNIRQSIRALTTSQLASVLRAEDPVMSERLRPSDTQRMARALEVIRATGQSLSKWQHKPTQPPLPRANITLYATHMDRELLYERINQRFDEMIEQGALEEAQSLLERGYDQDLPLMRAVGIAQLLPYLRDENVTLEEALQNAKTQSRRYAKRQLTWIRRQYPEVHYLNA